VFINCQVAFRVSEFLKVAITGYQSGHMRPGFFIFAWLLAPFDSFTTIFKPPPGCSSLRGLGFVLLAFGAFSRSGRLTKRSHPSVVDHFMFLPNRRLYESGYMKQHRESTGISNFVQIRHHQCALSDRGARLHNTSGKVINFGLPKCVCCVLERHIPFKYKKGYPTKGCANHITIRGRYSRLDSK